MKEVKQYMSKLQTIVKEQLGTEADFRLTDNMLVADFKTNSKNKDYKFVFTVVRHGFIKHKLVCKIMLKQTNRPDYKVRQDWRSLEHGLELNTLEKARCLHQLNRMLNVIKEDFNNEED